MGRAGRRVFKDKQVVFALDSVVHCFLFLFFLVTNSYIYFLIFTSYLHSLQFLQEGEKVTIDEEKTAVCFGVFF